MQHKKKISYYINIAKSLDIKGYEKKIRIALLGSFTLNGIEETLQAKCAELNVGCITFVSGYNQYNQEILNSTSDLYKFSPEISFLILDSRSILGKLFYFPYSISKVDRKILVEKRISEIGSLIKSYTNKSKSKLIITNLLIPTYSPYGLYETKVSYGLQEMINDFNSQLIKLVMTQESVYVYDFNGFVTRYGEKNTFDFRQFLFGDIKISLDCIPYLVHDWLGYIKAILGLNKKCIVLDLDNTLWEGVVGEDGFEGIKLGNDPIGKSFIEFQNVLLALHQRGIILAINSKNNQDDALHVIRDHPDMILREENFACMKINWNDKTTNMKEIANILNIGLDSMVFFDDDPVNREYMRLNLPQVLTVELPQDVTQYTQTLIIMNDFHLLKITEEDTNRGQMYLQDKQRKEFEQSTTSLQDFLNNLDIKLTIKQANDFTIPRISQLILKTNQFNLTTRRYQEEEIRKFTKEENYWVGCAQIEDKFGDNGITGVFIIKKENSEWLIDTFLLSCRVMGRKVENAILDYILQKAKETGVNILKGEFIPTNKNTPSESFFSDYGFKKDGRYWIYDLINNSTKPSSHITCVVE